MTYGASRRIRFHRPGFAVATLLTLSLVLSATPVLAVTRAYAGYGSNATWSGIDGYLRQSTSVPLSGTQAHVNYINVCGLNCATWVQTGTYQGLSPLGDHNYTAVHVYYENVDACGDYYFHDQGAAPSADYPYYLTWDGGSSYQQTCFDGSRHIAYLWQWRKGSVTSTPFFIGDLGFTAGQASAATEVHDGATIGTDYYGCDPNKACSSGGYGIHVFSGSSWSSLTNASAIGPYNPPYLRTFHNYWAFATCPVSC